jgi:hypothetical protein
MIEERAKDSKKFECDHRECSLKFKTKKQKLLHHNKLEPECKLQKMALTKLIAHFKKIYLKLSEGRNIKHSEQFLKLKRNYDMVEKNASDLDYFFSIMGDNYDDNPK